MKTVALITAALVIGAAVHGQDPVKVESINGATTVGVDVLSKPSATWRFVKNNWGKLALGAGTIIAVDRVADNNDWLWYEGNKKGKAVAAEPKKEEEPLIPPVPTASSTQTGTSGGDTTQQSYNSGGGDINITINN
jgi:hypothetical protein